MFGTRLTSYKEGLRGVAQRVQHVIKTWLTPRSQSLVLGAIGDAMRSRSELIAENALMWSWRQAILLVQPDTVLRWHRELFKHFWSGKSRHTGGKQPLAAHVVALIKQMASANPLWGAERIRGELIKLDIHVSKSTIQRYLPRNRAPRSSQTWRTFVHNHRDQIWASISFRSLTCCFARCLSSLSSRSAHGAWRMAVLPATNGCLGSAADTSSHAVRSYAALACARQ
jgi:hypothetical protein